MSDNNALRPILCVSLKSNFWAEKGKSVDTNFQEGLQFNCREYLYPEGEPHNTRPTHAPRRAWAAFFLIRTCNAYSDSL